MHQPVDLPDEPNIKFVRMSTGEDLITEIIEIKDDKEEYYVFVNPLKVLYITGEKPGSIMLSLIEWVFPKICSNQQFKIYPSDVITIADASEQLEEYYFEALIKMEKYSLKMGNEVSFTQEQEESLEEITDEDLEMLNKIMEDLKEGRRKLN